MANSALTILLNARDEASAAFKKVSRELGQMERATQKASAHLSGMSNKLMLATAPLLALGAAATKMAMDAVESENLFAVSMGGMAEDARRWSVTLRDQLGLNATEVRRSVAGFNVMFNSMGLGEQASYDMAKGLTLLSKDLASFYNLSESDALQKLRAGIVGETEPLRRLGIVINETTVEAWALRNGLMQAGGEMSEAQKVAARYGLILESTSKAQGDLARTIESPTNQLRMFQNRLQEAGETAGQVFLPMVSAALLWINNKGMPTVMGAIKRFAESWTELSDHAKAKMLVVAGLFVAGGPLLKGISVGIQGVGLLIAAFNLLPRRVTLAVGAAGAALFIFHEQIGNFFENFGKGLMIIGQGWERVFPGAQAAKDLREWGQSVSTWGHDLAGMQVELGDVAETALNLVDPAIEALTKRVESMTGSLLGDDGLEGAMASTVKGMDIAIPKLNLTADEFAKLAGPVDTAKKKVRQAAKEVGISIQEVITAMVRFHPATVAAAAGVSYWNRRIADVNLALLANQDQMKAAQAELSRMSERLSELNKQLGEQQRRLSELSKPQLSGMGEMGVQINAIQDALKRLDLADTMGKPFAEILAQYPLLTKGAMQYLGTLPQTREGLEAALKQLSALQDVTYDEKLRLIGDAAKDSVQELTFDEALKAIAETKSRIGSLTSDISAQEAAIRNQQNAIQAMQGAADAMNRTLVEFQAQLRQAEANQQLVTQALQLAFTWLIQDREKMQEMGAEGVAQSEIVDEATRALLTAIDLYATGVKDSVSGNLEGVVRAYEDALRRAQIIVSQMPAIPSVSVPVSVGEMPFAGSFAGGGVVPGPAGAPAWAIVHGGEPIGRAAGGGNTYVTVNVGGFVTAERDLAETIRRELILVKNRNVTTGL